MKQNESQGALPHLPRAVGYRHTMDNTEGIKGNKPQIYFSCTKPAPFGIPGLDYSASYPVTTEALFTADQMEAYARAALKAQPALTEAQSGKLMELFKHTLGSLALHDQAEAERIGKLYRDAQPSGNTGELAQGEDSARLDWLLQNPHITVSYSGAADFQWIFSNSISGKSSPCHLSGRDAIDRARASAETGGVKS